MTAATTYRLFALAHGRSGDKGDMVNIGIISRREGWYDLIRDELSVERVRAYLEPLGTGRVERFELPNLGALNFLVHDALGGGGAVTLALDAQGKTFAQALLRMPVSVPADVADAVRSHWSDAVPEGCVLSGDA